MNGYSPLVSVIVPVFRVEKYIGKCLNSIVKQTYSNMQIIIVDDGSDDGSPKVCDDFASIDKRVTVIHKENGGVSSARNTGLDLAVGEFIYFVDGDDLIHEECLEKLIEIQRKTQCDIVQTKTFAFLNQDILPPPFPDEELLELYSGQEFCKKYMFGDLGTDAGVLWNKLYKIELFDNLRFPFGMVYEDDAMLGQIYWKAAEICRCNFPLAYYRSKRSGSIMHSGKLKYDDMISARRMQYNFFMQQNSKELISQTLYLWANDYAVIRADKEHSREKELQLRQAHYKLIKKSKVSGMRRFINVLGYISPSMFLYIKYLKKRVS